MLEVTVITENQGRYQQSMHMKDVCGDEPVATLSRREEHARGLVASTKRTRVPTATTREPPISGSIRVTVAIMFMRWFRSVTLPPECSNMIRLGVRHAK